MAVLEPKGLEAHEKLVWARLRAGFKTASEAARANSWNENTYRSHENGERGIRPKAAEIYAAAYGLKATFFLTGTDNFSVTSRIPLLGCIKEHGILDKKGYFSGQEYLYHAAVHFLMDDSVAAYEVSETAYLIVLRPGDLVIVMRINAFVDKDPSRINGMLCLVGEARKPSLVRYVRGTAEHGLVNYDLPSIVPEFDQSPDFVDPVHVIVPAKHWKKGPA